ncbi:MAG: MAPEG family protein [Gammaproteobacteria bacterium]|nr:MAPEG family protein [Gammaproteobacteria bacterium]NND38283.1 glutathione S-transferase [Pseudomonadales bacterium]MBT8151294.1 MAPEG family protein [Gammaproteobacteria bacterium]NNL10589.1 glutathione S-transferase [Pseudomonadales bacterium]NNM11489.1 glutathione S-transferase [Pseudomonadales bacterium]
MTSTLSITCFYLVLLIAMYIPITLRVGGYRMRNKISLGDGGDAELLKRIRAHANFVETVPMAIFIIAVMELSGAGTGILHALGLLLVLARLSHYLQVAGFVKALPFRAGGMTATLFVYLLGGIWLATNVLF